MRPQTRSVHEICVQPWRPQSFLCHQKEGRFHQFGGSLNCEIKSTCIAAMIWDSFSTIFTIGRRRAALQGRKSLSYTSRSLLPAATNSFASDEASESSLSDTRYSGLLRGDFPWMPPFCKCWGRKLLVVAGIMTVSWARGCVGGIFTTTRPRGG